MPDSAVWTAAISAGSVLVAGLGSVSLTHRGTIRREERQAERQREEQRVLERRLAYAELLGAAAQLRIRIRAVSQRPWHDMNVRLTEIQERAAIFDRHAWGVALLSPALVAEAAHALTKAADGLVGHVVTKADMGESSGPDGQFVAGRLKIPANFSSFEHCLTSLQAEMAADIRAGCPPISAQVPGTPSGPWWRRRKASSR